MATGEVDDLSYLEITWVYPGVNSFDCGWGGSISVSKGPESITHFNCDIVSTCRDRATKDECDYEKPTCCQSKGDTCEMAHPSANGKYEIKRMLKY